jgi:multidrug transporter EmrE-like cation transporter
MAFTSWALILGAVLLGTMAQLLLKAGTTAVGSFAFSGANLIPVGWQLATQPLILGGIFAYGLSLIVWIMALSRVEVSIAYPMVSIGYVLTAIAAWYFLGESVSAMRIAGIGVIILGVVIVARS